MVYLASGKLVGLGSMGSKLGGLLSGIVRAGDLPRHISKNQLKLMSTVAVFTTVLVNIRVSLQKIPKKYNLYGNFTVLRATEVYG